MRVDLNMSDKFFNGPMSDMQRGKQRRTHERSSKVSSEGVELFFNNYFRTQHVLLIFLTLRLRYVTFTLRLRYVDVTLRLRYIYVYGPNF